MARSGMAAVRAPGPAATAAIPTDRGPDADRGFGRAPLGVRSPGGRSCKRWSCRRWRGRGWPVGRRPVRTRSRPWLARRCGLSRPCGRAAYRHTGLTAAMVPWPVRRPIIRRRGRGCGAPAPDRQDGARCRTRTGTALRPRDFKSRASTNSAKRACGSGPRRRAPPLLRCPPNVGVASRALAVRAGHRPDHRPARCAPPPPQAPGPRVRALGCRWRETPPERPHGRPHRRGSCRR